MHSPLSITKRTFYGSNRTGKFSDLALPCSPPVTVMVLSDSIEHFSELVLLVAAVPRAANAETVTRSLSTRAWGCAT